MLFAVLVAVRALLLLRQLTVRATQTMLWTVLWWLVATSMAIINLSFAIQLAELRGWLGQRNAIRSSMAGCVGLNRLQCSPTHEHCSTELSRPAPGACAGSTAATPPPTTSAPAPAITAAPNGLPEPLPERRCREWGQVPWGRKGGMAAGAAGSAGEGARTGAGARADRAAAARAGAHAEPHRPGEPGSRPRLGGGQGGLQRHQAHR